MQRMQVPTSVVALCGLVALGLAQAGAAQTTGLPPIQNLAGKVLTVTGPVSPDKIGPALMHEHMFIFFQPTHQRQRKMTPAQQRAYDQPLTLATLYQSRYGYGVAGSDDIGNFDLVRNEVAEFKKWGGDTIVDVSDIGLGRDPTALQELARVTGMHLIMGSGYYQKAYHPANMDRLTVDDLTRVIVHDIEVGAEGTNIRSGIIGEVGVNGNPLTPNEIKSVRASGRASRITGAPITFHYGGQWEEKFAVLDVLQSEGVDMSHVVMGHSGNLSQDLPFMLRLLKRGVTIQMDWVGVLGGGDGLFYGPTDMEKAKGIAALVKAGYANRIVLGHDICTPTQLKAYGGNGYAFISRYFLPALRRLGVGDKAIHMIMVDNPRRILTFTKPRPQIRHTQSELQRELQRALDVDKHMPKHPSEG